MLYYEPLPKLDKRKTKFVAFRIDTQLFQALQQKVLSDELTLSQAIRRALKHYVEDNLYSKK